jgi:hypothetical protein
MGQCLADYGWPATNVIWFANALPQPGRGPEPGHPDDERASWCGRGSGQASDDGRLHRPLWADHRGVDQQIHVRRLGSGEHRSPRAFSRWLDQALPTRAVMPAVMPAV